MLDVGQRCHYFKKQEKVKLTTSQGLQLNDKLFNSYASH